MWSLLLHLCRNQKSLMDIIWHSSISQFFIVILIAKKDSWKKGQFLVRSVYVNRKRRGKYDKKMILNNNSKGLPLGISVLGIISVTLYTSMFHCSAAVCLKDLQVIVINLARGRDCHIPRDIFKRYLNLRNSHLCQPLSIQLTRIFCSTPNTSFSASLHR